MSSWVPEASTPGGIFSTPMVQSSIEIINSFPQYMVEDLGAKAHSVENGWGMDMRVAGMGEP